MNFANRIRDLKVEPNSVAIAWLGQASYLLKSPSGQIVMIDPYLSDWAETQWGVKRVIPPPFTAAELQLDLLLISHWHEDHFDEPVIKEWIAAGVEGDFVGPVSCSSRVIAWGWPADQVWEISEGESHEFGEVRVTATYARHEDPTAPSPDAVGFMIEIGGVRVWDIADSEYDAHLREFTGMDVALLPINGVGGNMNAHEAALLAWHTQPRIAIPMHYNMWSPADFGPGATLDPQDFINALDSLGGGPEMKILAVGDVFTLSAGLDLL